MSSLMLRVVMRVDFSPVWVRAIYSTEVCYVSS